MVRALCTTDATELLKNDAAVPPVLLSVLELRLLDETALPLLYVQCVAVLQVLLLLLLLLLKWLITLVKVGALPLLQLLITLVAWTLLT